MNRQIHRAVAGVGDPGYCTTYDALGRKASETDPSGLTTTFGYDPVGRLVAVTNAAGYATCFTYDEVGNQIQQIDANLHATRFEYDSMGRRLRRELPGVRTGRASTGLLENLMVEAYGAKVPLNQVATLSIPEPSLIVAQPFDPSRFEFSDGPAALPIAPPFAGNAGFYGFSASASGVLAYGVHRLLVGDGQ